MSMHVEMTPSAELDLERWLESIKHYLWHGNSSRALERLQDVADETITIQGVRRLHRLQH